MKRKERAEAIVAYFQREMPVAETELKYDNPFQLLVAVILSAQCTDKRVNMVTPPLFAQFPDAYTMAKASQEEIFGWIKSISYPNNKSKHLVGMAKLLVDEFQGEVPGTMKELIRLPGVGRKTANVILSVVYHQPAFAVDTHVFRVSKRLGLANQNAKTPLEVEKQLMPSFPADLVPLAHHWLILHGRYTCLARKPKCPECGLQSLCRYYQKKHGNTLASS